MTSAEPLHQQVYAAMVERIRSGHWREGEQVPSEQTLVEEFGTSRGPVRQALARLRAEGLLIGGRGAPPRVQKVVPSQPFDTYISFTEWAESLGRDLTQVTIEVARRGAGAVIAEKLEVPEGSFVIEVVRVRSLDGEPVMVERGAYPYDVGRHLLTADLDENSIYRILREQDICPVRARNVIDAVAADAQQGEWLRVEAGSPLLRVRRQSFDGRGRPVDFAENFYLPSHATFAVENTRAQTPGLSRVTIDAPSSDRASSHASH
ncbi:MULTISPECIES: GntR family transcriptional regulator [Actinomycetes]